MSMKLLAAPLMATALALSWSIAAIADEGRPFTLAQATPAPSQSTEDIFWQSIQSSSDPAMFQAYLDQVANGTFKGAYKPLAEIKLNGLRKAASPSPAPVPAPAAPAEAAPAKAASPPPTEAAADSSFEACDRAAAIPANAEVPSNVPGVSYESIDSGSAIRNCRKAVDLPGAPRRIFFQLGRAYGKAGNLIDATKYYVKASELGYPPAMHNLATMYAGGKGGLKRDPALALALFEKAAAAGQGESLVQLGAMAADGRGGPRSYAKAIDYYQQAIKADIPGGYTNLGVLYFNGRGVARDRGKACELWQQGSSRGDPAASSNLRRNCRVR